MPPRSPLPPRHGLAAAWVRTPDRDWAKTPPWPTMLAWLREKLPARVEVDSLLVEGRFVDERGRSITASTPYTPHTFIWFHRELREEPVVPGKIEILHRDDRLVVVDKPPFLSTIPRGRHVMQSVVVRLREELGLPELTPVHRLDRITSGVLVLATHREWRGPYQRLFHEREVGKTYLALAPPVKSVDLPVTVRNHLRKDRGKWQVTVVPDAPVNAETLVELDRSAGELCVYRLTPSTGRTHQLRAHLSGLGAPIVGDPLYPEVVNTRIDDFSAPLQLLAYQLSFTDPVDDVGRCFTSRRSLPLTPEPGA